MFARQGNYLLNYSEDEQKHHLECTQNSSQSTESVQYTFKVMVISTQILFLKTFKMGPSHPYLQLVFSPGQCSEHRLGPVTCFSQTQCRDIQEYRTQDQVIKRAYGPLQAHSLHVLRKRCCHGRSPSPLRSVQQERNQERLLGQQRD